MSPAALAPVRALVTLALTAVALASGPAHAASPACEPEAAVAIEVAAELGDASDDEAMHAYLEDRLPERLGTEGLCVDPEAPRRVIATVAWSNAARGDYAIALRAADEDGEPFEPSAVDCPGCATVEVLDTIVAQVPVALAGLQEAHARAEPAPARPPVVAPTERPEATPPAPHDRHRLSRLGHAGIGVAATGLAGIVAGAVLWNQHSVLHPADHDYRLVLRPAGITLVVSGVLATAAGGTMIGLDLRRRTKRVSLRPSFEQGQAGVIVSGAF